MCLIKFKALVKTKIVHQNSIFSGKKHWLTITIHAACTSIHSSGLVEYHTYHINIVSQHALCWWEAHSHSNSEEAVTWRVDMFLLWHREFLWVILVYGHMLTRYLVNDLWAKFLMRCFIVRVFYRQVAYNFLPYNCLWKLPSFYRWNIFIYFPSDSYLLFDLKLFTYFYCF